MDDLENINGETLKEANFQCITLPLGLIFGFIFLKVSWYCVFEIPFIEFG